MQTTIQTPTPNLRGSLDFYKKLNFTILEEGKTVKVSDGSVIIEINPDRYARAGVKMYAKDWKSTVEELKKLTTVKETEEGYVLASPSGTWVYLQNDELDFDLTDAAASKFGNGMGLSLETIPFGDSLQFWQTLGYTIAMGTEEQGFVVLNRDNSVGISLMSPLMCPHLFFNPSLTYFNGKNNPKVIADIREAGIPITEEITHFSKENKVDNVIIRDPGGLGFFIFND